MFDKSRRHWTFSAFKCVVSALFTSDKYYGLIIFINLLIRPDNGRTGNAITGPGAVFELLFRMDHDWAADDVGETMKSDHLVHLIDVALAIFTRQIANLANFTVAARLFPAEIDGKLI